MVCQGKITKKKKNLNPLKVRSDRQIMFNTRGYDGEVLNTSEAMMHMREERAVLNYRIDVLKDDDPDLSVRRSVLEEELRRLRKYRDRQTALTKASKRRRELKLQQERAGEQKMEGEKGEDLLQQRMCELENLVKRHICSSSTVDRDLQTVPPNTTLMDSQNEDSQTSEESSNSDYFQENKNSDSSHVVSNWLSRIF